MKIAVLSDIHGNHIALRRCVEYALDRGITTFIFLGDYLGEMPYPQKTMEYLYEIKQTYTCYFIRGNRDEYWLNYCKGGETGWKKGNSASGSLLYTYERITERDLAFFESLPTKQVLSFPELPFLTICHGSPNKVNEKMEPGKEKTYEIMKAESSSYILCGHTHVQGEIRYEDKTVWNPGSVGISKKCKGKTQFMILYGTDHGWQQEFLSLTYDAKTVISQLDEEGLDVYAPYWCMVTKYALRGEDVDHGIVLDRVIELCKQKYGQCDWANIPEECWAQAVEEMVKSL